MVAARRFLKLVLRSGLLNRDELSDALRGLPREQWEDAQAMADYLIKGGRLSRYQARKLLQGIARGLVLGPYQILAPVGRGGMGTVFLSRDSRSQRLLALKVLPPKRAREEERVLARFQREMVLSQRVSHPNIARTLDVGVHDGIYYIAMEFIPGKSLYQLVTEGGPLEVSRSARLFAEVAEALQHAHEQGVIHRDLKPSNIMVTPNDHAKVLDLGLAMIQGEAVTNREVVGGSRYVIGSMNYIAPEQTEDSSKVDARADVYGLGCTLYHAVTGSPPFPGGSSIDKIMWHRTIEPPPPEEVNPKIPPAFADLIKRMMAKDPAQRMASAEMVRRQLLPWASGEALPMDRQDDSGFLTVVDRLKAAEPTTDVGDTELSAPEEEESAVEVSAEDLLMPEKEETKPELLTGALEDKSWKEIAWMSGAFVGFWVLLLAILGLVLWFR
jgi:eukaryotic-like serine/threonine-protein kinase